LERFLYFGLNELPYVLVALLIAFSVHEFSHAYVAYKLGDPTAERAGRLTLNPIAHLDPIGTLMIFFAGFGWAKPVPVNLFILRDKRFAGVYISLAGPLSNLVIATLTLGLGYLLIGTGVLDAISATRYYDPVINLINIIINLNLMLFVFNLLPIPPLDGYRIIEGLLPSAHRPRLRAVEMYGPFFLLLMVLTPLGDYFFSGVFYPFKELILTGLNNFYQLFF